VRRWGGGAGAGPEGRWKAGFVARDYPPGHASTRVRISAAVLLLLLAGCANAPAPATSGPDPAPEGSPRLEAYRVLLHTESALLVYNHPVCGLPESADQFDFERSPGLIVAGTSVLRFDYLIGGTWADGLRVGWSVDGAEPEWSPLLPPGEGSFDVPVDEAQWESDQPRWAFVYRPSRNGGDADCPTGQYVDGGFQLTVMGRP
jgi:hypothetical protein